MADLNGAADEPLYATCCYVSVDSAGGRLRTSRAGHPHPIVTADRHPARLLAADGGLPLGIDQGHRYRQSTFAVRPGSTLLLYTDGLTERPGLRAAEDDGILAELDGIGSADPATIVARLRAFSDPRSGYDDIAVLAARFTGSWGA